MYLHICTNQRHKCCILSMQQSEMLLCALNLVFFILGFAIYLVFIYLFIYTTFIKCSIHKQICSNAYTPDVAYGVGFTLQGLPIVTWISNFKQQTIVGGQYLEQVPLPVY